MRKVVETRQVAHLWANKSQDQARNPNDSFSFVGACIHSYGSHYVIAMHLEDGSILWNDSTYSNTTTRHASHVANAMTAAQWQRRVHVPSMGDNETRNIERLRGTLGTGKVRPELADQCADRVLSAIEAIGTANVRATRVMSDAWGIAKRYEASGKFLCEYVRKGKHVPAWPIPALPDALPIDKAERAALVRSLVKGKLLETYKSAMSEAQSRIANIRGMLDIDDDAYQLNNILGTVSGMWAAMSVADTAYQSAMGKKSSALAKMTKECAAVEVLAKAKHDAFQLHHARAGAKKLERSGFRVLQLRKQGKTSPWPSRDAGHVASQFDSAQLALPAGEYAPYAALHARLQRIADYDAAVRGVERGEDEIVSARAYLPQCPGDARRHYGQAFAAFEDALRRSPAFAAFKGAMVRERIHHVQKEMSALHAAIQAKHATDIAAWIAGEKNYIPHDAGTYARVQGNEVVTSRGARVPIEHACRLARIARRVIAAGGKAWADGAGPMVGGFRVNRIGSDGAASIGCHEFTGEEALRLLAVLESCAECQHVEEMAGV